MSYVAMGTWGRDADLCELKLRPMERVRPRLTLKSIKLQKQSGYWERWGCAEGAEVAFYKTEIK